jgi:methionyl aminopeptidase
MRKYGGFIPGIRPGRNTAEYMNKILTKITVVGGHVSVDPVPDSHIMISGIKLQHLPLIGNFIDAHFPRFLLEGLNVNFYFGGTSLLIVVGVAMDTINQIEAQLIMRHYEGFTPRAGYYTQAAGSKYPYVLCTSVNEQIVHGMPSARTKLKKGDIVSIDTGVQLNGYFGDSAITVPVGEISDSAKRLLKVTQESLELAIDKARAGNRLFDICGTVEQHVVENGFSVVREMVGHGIGTKLHEEPQIPNYVDKRNENPRLKEGMVLAIEPMVNAGAADMKVLKDKWTAVTKDGSVSAHFEHCVAVTANGPWVLTRP